MDVERVRNLLSFYLRQFEHCAHRFEASRRLRAQRVALMQALGVVCEHLNVVLTWPKASKECSHMLPIMIKRCYHTGADASGGAGSHLRLANWLGCYARDDNARLALKCASRMMARHGWCYLSLHDLASALYAYLAQLSITNQIALKESEANLLNA